MSVQVFRGAAVFSRCLHKERSDQRHVQYSVNESYM